MVGEKITTATAMRANIMVAAMRFAPAPRLDNVCSMKLSPLASLKNRPYFESPWGKKARDFFVFPVILDFQDFRILGPLGRMNDNLLSLLWNIIIPAAPKAPPLPGEVPDEA